MKRGEGGNNVGWWRRQQWCWPHYGWCWIGGGSRRAVVVTIGIATIWRKRNSPSGIMNSSRRDWKWSNGIGDNIEVIGGGGQSSTWSGDVDGCHLSRLTVFMRHQLNCKSVMNISYCTVSQWLCFVAFCPGWLLFGLIEPFILHSSLLLIVNVSLIFFHHNSYCLLGCKLIVESIYCHSRCDHFLLIFDVWSFVEMMAWLDRVYQALLFDACFVKFEGTNVFDKNWPSAIWSQTIQSRVPCCWPTDPTLTLILCAVLWWHLEKHHIWDLLVP